MLDLPYNLAVLLVDAAALLAIARWPRPRTVLRAAFLAGAAAVALTAPFRIEGFHAMRLLCWALFVHAPLDLLGAAVLLWRAPGRAAAGSEGEERADPRVRPLVGALVGLAALLVAVAVDAFLIEPTWLEVTRLRLPAPGLARPLRIVLLADIQTDHIGEHERAALRRAAECDADLVLFAGDYVQCIGWPAQRREAEAFRQALLETGLGGRLGGFAVQGDVDEDGWTEQFRGTRIATRPAFTSERPREDVELICLPTPLSRSPGLKLPPRDGRYRILLGHAPDVALGDPDADLVLAGHIHGGQVRLPGIGPLLTLSQVPRRMAVGATTLPSGLTLVVSRGIGLERVYAPRLRFLCRPELVVLDLVPAPRRATAAGVDPRGE
ncbi:MAG: metallophosphoesterase [Planctomycetota bacterium]